MFRLARHHVLGWCVQPVIPIAHRHKPLSHSRFSTGPGLATLTEPPNLNGSGGNDAVVENGNAKSGTGEGGDGKNGEAKYRAGEGGDTIGARVWHFLKDARWATFGSASAISLIIGDIGYAYWRGKKRERKIQAAFQPAAVLDPPHFVERPAIEKMVRSTILSGTENYDVIVGNHGTGKSTIVEKIAKETPGAVYVFIKPLANVNKAMTKAFIEALNWEEPQITWREVVLKTVFLSSANRRTDNDNDNEPDFMRLLDDFEHFAAQYKAETGSHAVLVLDNTNVLIPENPKILDMLQDLAKTACDKDLYKVVFVCSDGTAPIRMEGRSAWSRGPAPGGELRIGDLTHREAMEYLTVGRKIAPNHALEIIAFCGTRIQLLKRTSKRLDAGVSLEALIAEATEGAWIKFKKQSATIDKDLAFALAKRILGHGPIAEEEYGELCGRPEVGDQFLARNVFAINSNGLYDFDSKITENAVRRELG